MKQKTLEFWSKEDRIRFNIEPAPKKESKTLTDLRFIVRAYKIKTGCENDVGWNILNYAKCLKYAKKLLQYFGNWQDAVHCIDEIGTELESKGLDWSLSAVCGRAADWKMKREKNNEQN